MEQSQTAWGSRRERVEHNLRKSVTVRKTELLAIGKETREWQDKGSKSDEREGRQHILSQRSSAEAIDGGPCYSPRA